jgi:hypothetical protein
MQQDAFFKPTHCLNSNGAVCRVIQNLQRGEVVIEFINGMQSRVAVSEISTIKKEQANGNHYPA